MQCSTDRGLSENALSDRGLSVIDSQKAALLDRLEYIRNQSELIKKEIRDKCKEYRETLENSSNLIIRDLDIIISQVNALSEKANSYSSTFKHYLNPLEDFLFKSTNLNFLDNLIGPRVVFPASDFKFKLSYPTFLHELTTYSKQAIGFKENHLVTSPKSISLKNGLFNSSSRCLQVNHKQIIVTGSYHKCSCLLINLASKTITPLPNLKKCRKWHAMSWLNGFPCVLGGKVDEVDSTSVEILKNTSWIDEKGMVVPRSSFSAIDYMDKVWAVGGINGRTMSSVEFYSNGEWSLLNVKSDLFCSSVGLVGVGPYLLILGGFKISEKSKLSLLNLQDESLFNVFEFSEEVYFYLNSIAVTTDKFVAFDYSLTLQEINKSEVCP